MLQPENRPQKYETLFVDIDEGRIKIPQFQRDFVWTKEQTARLIDSILRGYPIGTFILWKTSEDLRSYREIGNHTLASPPQGDPVEYVLDGQQRITSLYAVRKGLVIDRDGTAVDYTDIHIDLGADPEEDDEGLVVDEAPEGPSISVHELLSSKTADLYRGRSDAEIDRIDLYKGRLTGYDFSTIVIRDYPIDVACDVFTRINTGGTKLTLFEIMVAKTYDPSKGFDLAERYERLLDDPEGRDLKGAGYETVGEDVVLQCVSAHLAGSTLRKDVLRLDKANFIEAWPVVTGALFAAVDFLRQSVRVPVSRLLPSDRVLIPLTYFFARASGGQATTAQKRFLGQFFWWTGFTRRYSSASGGKLAADLKRMDTVLAGEAPEYRADDRVALTAEDVAGSWFSTGDAFSKAVLCVLAGQRPVSFATGDAVDLDNSWLKVSNSKNYHHFFPRAFVKKLPGVEDWRANVVANITFVDDHLNKRRIGAKPPSEYMRTFEAENEALASAMETHLIGDLGAFGVRDDDYERFLAARSQRIVEEVIARLNPGHGAHPAYSLAAAETHSPVAEEPS